MNEFETTLHLMMLEHISYDELASRLGQPNGGNLYTSLNKNKNLYVSSFRKILDAIGYELVVREKGETDGGYIISDDNTPSPLRFHDMSMEFGVDRTKKRLNLSRTERLQQTEELKTQRSELSLFECEERLREIWSTVNPVRKKVSTISEYEGEYLKYLQEFRVLYSEDSPVSHEPTKTVGKRIPLVNRSAPSEPKAVITEDTIETKDMSKSAIFERQKEAMKNKRDYLASLTADFTMED